MKDLLKSSIKKSIPPADRWGIASGVALYGLVLGTLYPLHGFRGATGTGYETCKIRVPPVATVPGSSRA